MAFINKILGLSYQHPKQGDYYTQEILSDIREASKLVRLTVRVLASITWAGLMPCQQEMQRGSFLELVLENTDEDAILIWTLVIARV